jgi:tellurite resistance protein TerC
VLVYTGVKLFVQKGTEVHPERNLLFRLFARVVPAVSEYRGPRFVVRELGRWCATPLLLVLVAIEATDVVFALDSIPAIFAITLDPFIVYTSNICAILGLRALFFLLAGVMEGLHYLRAGLAAVLVFVGIKMLAADLYKDKVSDQVAIVVSLAVVTLLIGGAVVASLVRQRLIAGAPPDAPPDAPKD